MTTYRALTITKFGGPMVLQMTEKQLAAPRAGEARVQVLAAGVAFSDVWLRKGLYPNGPKPPFVPGYDVFGVVEAVGPGVTTLIPGQHVAALTVTGGYAEVITLPVHDLVPAPAGLDPAEAVTVVQSYLTAYQMLHRIARTAPGERALIHAGAGSVGIALLQLGRLAGLELYATASRNKQAMITKLGGRPIDYRNEDVVARVREWTGDGVDLVFDPIGGRNVARSLEMMRAGGRVIVYGFQTGHRRNWFDFPRVTAELVLRTRFDPMKAGDGNQGVFAFNVTTLKRQQPTWHHDDLTALFALLARGEIRPEVADRLPLSRAAEAHRRLERSEVIGKLVLISAMP